MQLDPIRDTSCHAADVNKVKVVSRVSPFLVDIIDLKFAVGWNKAGLNRRQIHANDFGRWVFISKLTKGYINNKSL